VKKLTGNDADESKMSNATFQFWGTERIDSPISSSSSTPTSITALPRFLFCLLLSLHHSRLSCYLFYFPAF